MFSVLQVSLASKLKHENLVEMLGYCVDGNYRILAYEFATMGSLHDVLHGKTLSIQYLFMSHVHTLYSLGCHTHL